MPTPTYTALVSVVAKFIDPTKANDIVKRQLEAKSLSPDSLGAGDLVALSNAVGIAASLYVPDPKIREQVKEAVKAYCG